jgi:bifunctional DNA-binding transcriptional regulator/antitoxin component of YhaV-PrlF toxin-antitoxin module
MRVIGAGAFLLGCLMFASTQESAFNHQQAQQTPSQEARKLFPINDGHAFIDANGRIVFTATDSQLQEDVILASTKLGGIRGPRDGVPVFLRVEEEFSEGLAVVGWALCPMCRNNFWVNGFVDETGRLVIPPKHAFTRYESFREGLAKYTDRGWGFIDRRGQVVIPAQYTETGNFSEGLAFVAGVERQRYGYINKTGELAIPYQFKYASDFHEGLALVILRDVQYAFINRTGKVVLQSRSWQGVDHFSEGLAAVRLSITNNHVYRGYQELKYGFIDRSGRVVVSPQFDRAEKFSEGRALIGQVIDDKSRSRDGIYGGPLRVGFIDPTGQVVIKPVYVDGKVFSEGLAAVAVMTADKKKVWGYIDRDGRMVITPQFTSANPFSGGLAAVNCDQYGRDCKAYVDKGGQIIWQATPTFSR